MVETRLAVERQNTEENNRMQEQNERYNISSRTKRENLRF